MFPGKWHDESGPSGRGCVWDFLNLMKEEMREQWIRERSSQTVGSVIFAFCGQVAFSVGSNFSALLSMGWKAAIGGFQITAGIWVPRTENGLETVTIICFENAIIC